MGDTFYDNRLGAVGYDWENMGGCLCRLLTLASKLEPPMAEIGWLGILLSINATNPFLDQNCTTD